MKLRKYNVEEGFLLMESLFTLFILTIVLLFLNPLAVEWLSNRQAAKDLVEESRQLYEKSMELKNTFVKTAIDEKGTMRIDRYSIKIKESGTGVFIYESNFEYE
ncbi:MAG: hypothetical protein L0I79_06765 [Atopostipes sp.]|nr:hypothetical protein [Atopostipes sp.]